jgi:signal transduction histidine kinase
MRPLDRLPSIKLKLGVVILAAVVVTVVVVSVGEQLGISPVVTGLAAAVLALAMIQFLAHGMTYPLREMVAATRAMAKGDYDVAVTATSRDEVGELARAFNTMSRQLAEVDRFRRELVANASHELRTPLGALRARLENLVDGVEEADRAALAEALGQAERLGNLVEQLLDLSRLESGAVPLELEEVQALQLFEQVVAEWRQHADLRRVQLESFALPAGLTLRVDPGRMRQVLGNLVANSIRHSSEGGRVVLTARANNGRPVVEVVDDGPGIAPDELERVFERFYRSDRARSADEGGAGLGLAIARWIVELHGGSIAAAEANPHGCRIVVKLPK